MTPLEEQIADVEREVKILIDTGDTRIAIEELDAVNDDLEDCFQKLVAAKRQWEAIAHHAHISFSVDDGAEHELMNRSVEQYKNVRVAWAEDKSRIRQSGTVGELVEALEDWAREVLNKSAEKWEEWFSNSTSRYAVSATELDSIRNVPELKEPVAEYQKHSAVLAELAKRVPGDEPGVATITDLVEKLAGIKSGLKFDLPDFVLEFFDNLDRQGTVSLSALSQELLAWLGEHDELKNLSVTRRRASGRW